MDAIDKKTLEFLQQDSKMTTKELSLKLNLSVTAVYERIKKMEREGIISKYVALLDKNKIDKGFVVFCNAVVDVSHKVLLQNIAFKVFDGSVQVIWISIINAFIILPFLLLFTVSGYLSDKYNKKNILVYGAVSSFLLSILISEKSKK